MRAKNSERPIKNPARNARQRRQAEAHRHALREASTFQPMPMSLGLS